MNAYYKETEKPFGYLLVDNKPNTPADKQVLADLFGECYVYHFGVSRTDTEPTCVEPACKHSTAPVTKTKPAEKLQAITWSDVPMDAWQKYTLGAPAVSKTPEGYICYHRDVQHIV